MVVQREIYDLMKKIGKKVEFNMMQNTMYFVPKNKEDIKKITDIIKEYNQTFSHKFKVAPQSIETQQLAGEMSHPIWMPGKKRIFYFVFQG